MKQMSRRERIEFLLDHWPDFFETSGTMESRGEPGGDDGGVALLPRMARHPSVIELARCLGSLSDVCPNHYRHLRGFYSAAWRTVRQPKTRLVKGRVVRLDADPRKPEDWDYARRRVVPAWVLMRMVELGVIGITAEGFAAYSFEGEVFIPTELLEVAA